jgi:C-terminal processing protease CtpA/Prc
MHKTGAGHDAFSSPEPMHLSPAAGVIWLRPVIVLTNRGVFSSANHFVMMMRELPHVTIMGDKTGGGSGMPMSNTLPNGWSLRYSASPILDAQGNHTEFGIEPDVKVEITSEDWDKGIDTIIEEAIKLAKELTKAKEE